MHDLFSEYKINLYSKLISLPSYAFLLNTQHFQAEQIRSAVPSESCLQIGEDLRKSGDRQVMCVLLFLL